MDTSDKNVVISTHYLIYGAPQALRDYLISRKVQELLYIAHPLSTDGNRSYFEEICRGKVLQKKESRLRTGIGLLNYPIELFLTLKKCIGRKAKIDLFIGVDNLNAFAGVLLKKLGIVKTTVFYTIDYVPKRFDNGILNRIYHWADAFCVRNCDYTWNVSERITAAREEYRKINRKKYPQQIVPIGVWPDKVKVLPFGKIRKHRLLFIGHLLQKQGVQYVLDAVPEISRQIPDFDFLVVGGGEYENELRKQAKRLGITNRVKFTGWIKDRSKIDAVMADSAVAIAMYQKYDEKGNISFTYFADPTKVKDYLSAGLPVILTDVAHNAHEIERRGCGKVIKLDGKDIAQAVVSMMRDEKALKKSRTSARKYALLFGWDVIFARALKGLK